MTVYGELGVRTLINAKGPATRLSGGIMRPEVAEAMADASQACVDIADLQAAADLAAHFSRGRGNRRVPVVMVPTEELQRIPGAAPGTVRHRGGTVLWAEPGRALALLGAAPPAGQAGGRTCPRRENRYRLSWRPPRRPAPSPAFSTTPATCSA